LGYQVGLPHLQKDRAAEGLESLVEQRAGNPLPAEFRRHGEVGNLALVSRQGARHQEPRDTISHHCDPKILAQPFWETKPPEAWTDAQIQAVRTDSPWAQQSAEAPVVVIYLATAAPIEQGEAELRLRLKKNPRPMAEPDPDYVEYLSSHREEVFVLAVTYPTLKGLGDARESKRMEEESVMLIGKQRSEES